MNQKSLKQKSHSLSEYARTLFPVESTNNIQIKITNHKFIGDGCIWEGISLKRYFVDSVSQCSI